MRQSGQNALQCVFPNFVEVVGEVYEEFGKDSNFVLLFSYHILTCCCVVIATRVGHDIRAMLTPPVTLDPAKIAANTAEMQARIATLEQTVHALTTQLAASEARHGKGGSSGIGIGATTVSVVVDDNSGVDDKAQEGVAVEGIAMAIAVRIEDGATEK